MPTALASHHQKSVEDDHERYDGGDGGPSGSGSGSRSAQMTATSAYHQNGSQDGVAQDDDDDDDWLMSDDEFGGDASGSAAVSAQPIDDDDDNDETLMGLEMANRDSAKVKRTFYDTGYRDGITSGKLSTLQAGFDQGFNLSAPVARSRGILRGQASAVQIYLAEYNQSKRPAKGGAAVRARNAANSSSPSPSTGADSPKATSQRQATARQLLLEIQSLNVENLLEPDWEARKHELEHRQGSGTTADDDSDAAKFLSETDEDRHTRLHKISELQKRADVLLKDIMG